MLSGRTGTVMRHWTGLWKGQ